VARKIVWPNPAVEVRVFYDVTEKTVEVLAILSKAEAAGWLAKEATPTTPSGFGKGEG
jgi:hypothetical protein